MTRATFERIRALPSVVRARDCCGLLFGRPLPRSLYLEMFERDELGEFWQYINLKTPPNECAYCGGSIDAAMLAKYPSCPRCAGPWEDALLRVEA